MKTQLNNAIQAIKSLFARAPERFANLTRAIRPQRRRVIEIEYRRRPDTGTRRSAAIHIDSGKGRRQRP
jgi:hypothetical protein